MQELYIDRLLYPVTALGPGNRIAIWVSGCSRKCLGCANPELWERHAEQAISPLKLAETVKSLSRTKEIDGITITGGEPFDQASEISIFLKHLEFKADILVYSGYRLSELEHGKERRELLGIIDVLIDGEYAEELNDGVSALRGSVNQNIYYLSEDADDSNRNKYEEYLKLGRQIQNFIYDYRILSVGIHNPPEK